MGKLLDAALRAEHVILSVIGAHAGEKTFTIFERKIADIARCSRTLWLCCSPAASPKHAYSFFTDVGYVLFVEPAARSGARATTSIERASECSPDRHSWYTISPDLSPVTGRLRGGYALVISEIEIAPSPLDLWAYSEPKGGPVRFRLGASTLLAEKRDSSTHPERAKKQIRRITAVGRLEKPFAVWVR